MRHTNRMFYPIGHIKRILILFRHVFFFYQGHSVYAQFYDDNSVRIKCICTDFYDRINYLQRLILSKAYKCIYFCLLRMVRIGISRRKNCTIFAYVLFYRQLIVFPFTYPNFYKWLHINDVVVGR